ncbi:MAG: hypothetical protein R3F59_17350 [Myxococcota bacterium]
MWVAIALGGVVIGVLSLGLVTMLQFAASKQIELATLPPPAPPAPIVSEDTGAALLGRTRRSRRSGRRRGWSRCGGRRRRRTSGSSGRTHGPRRRTRTCRTWRRGCGLMTLVMGGLGACCCCRRAAAGG